MACRQCLTVLNISKNSEKPADGGMGHWTFSAQYKLCPHAPAQACEVVGCRCSMRCPRLLQNPGWL